MIQVLFYIGLLLELIGTLLGVIHPTWVDVGAILVAAWLLRVTYSGPEK